MNTRLENTFSNEHTKLIPYLTLGDGDLETSYKAIISMVEAGADMIELGVPFTDPVADGPTIQKSSERALKNPITLDDIFAMTKRLREDGIDVPFIMMSYANPIYAYGLERFCTAAVAHGIDGCLLTDVPPEESEDYLRYARAAGLETVFLCSPTTSQARLQLVDQSSSAFVYYVARAGVTGVRADLPADVVETLSALKTTLKNKLCIGFGISTPQQAKTLAPHADGLIIGSAIVKMFETLEGEELQRAIRGFVSTIKEAMAS